MRAWLKHPIGRTMVDELEVTMVARTSRDRISVEFNTGQHFSVDRYRLRRVDDRKTRITDDEFDRLPWRGKGVDPLTLSTRELFKSLEQTP